MSRPTMTGAASQGTTLRRRPGPPRTPVPDRRASSREASPRQRSRLAAQPLSTRLFGYALIAPIVVIMGLVIVYPLINAVVTSFQDQRVIGSSSDFVGFATYAKIIGDPEFWAALGRSTFWLFANMIVQTVFGFMTALLLQRSGRWSRTARTWIVLPWVIPTVAVAVIWQWMLNSNYGVIYKAFDSIGIDIGSPFGDSAIALVAIVLINSWHWFPLSAVIIYGALSTVPHEVIEAARMDGANAWRLFWAVTYPLLQPVLFSIALVGSLWSFNILDSIYLITEGGPAGSTTTVPVYIYDTAFSAFRSSQAAAASVLTVIVLGVAALLFVRFGRPKED
ncbi:sugar ABC transporter permease [Microbacterium luteolum]|uniref:Sugar ABC transporter permease n=1 Tax=Microbacterium luteolum TaxID=69367 RepID=A0ABY7XU34_MICLT|nr:sugar ABC transporter permease [Microbacterium luteolum]WDM44467.1 sugar ABC transporter permease [Microbacterium luteolum]